MVELRRIAALSRAQLAGENFPVALRLLPRGPRQDLVHLYEFARFVDDVGDEASGDRSALLDIVDADLDQLEAGAAALEPVRGLTPLLRKGVPTEPFHDLVEANRRDQVHHDYETFSDLFDYCRLSAAPVGRVVLRLAGVTDARAIQRSDRVCAALQILEHCQDVGEDAHTGRIYLPAVDRRAAGLDDRDLLSRQTSPALRQVIAELVARADDLLDDGVGLARVLRGWARLAVTGYVAGGRATVAALARSNYDVLPATITPTRLNTVGQALRVVVGR